MFDSSEERKRKKDKKERKFSKLIHGTPFTHELFKENGYIKFMGSVHKYAYNIY